MHAQRDAIDGITFGPRQEAAACTAPQVDAAGFPSDVPVPAVVHTTAPDAVRRVADALVGIPRAA